MKCGIALKIIGLAFALVLAMALALGWLSIGENSAIVLGLEKANLKNMAQRQGVVFHSKILELRQDVWYLANSPEVRSLLRARAASDKMDSQTQLTEDQCRFKLEESLKALLQRKTHYIQARYIDRTGFEVVRVHRQRHDETIEVEPNPESINKKDTKYFAATIDLPANDVYLSEIELNREGQDRHVDPARVPVLRAGVPVYQLDQRASGIIIINMDFDPLSIAFKVAAAVDNRIPYVTNEQGDFLVHPDPKMEYGFDFGKQFRIQSVYLSPKLRGLFVAGKSDRKEHSVEEQLPAQEEASVEDEISVEEGLSIEAKTNSGDAQFVMHFCKVRFDPRAGQEDRFLGIAVAAGRDEFLTQSHEFQDTLIRRAAALLVVAAGLAFVLSGLITRPLKQITRATNRFAAGDYDVKLPEEAGDEIGLLSRAFRSMVTQVRQRDEALRERQARIVAILDTAAEGIITLDEQGLVDSFNDAAEEIFGYRETELQGNSIQALMPWPCQGQTETTGTRKDGTTFPIELAVSEVPLDHRRLFALIVRDVTERKQAEEEIRALNKDLDRRVQERTLELETAFHELGKTNEELKTVQEHVEQSNAELQTEVAVRKLAEEKALEANRMKSQFLANMSHELRTPLNAVIGYSEMLQEECEDLGQDEFLPDLEKINSAGKHLLALINDILDLSKIGAGKVDLEWSSFDLKTMLEDAVTTIRPIIEKNGNEMRLECADDLGSICSDVTRLRQCLFNLLSNSGKFTHEGRITLDVNREDRGGEDWFILKVIDTGIGMTREQMDRLFQAFSQADISTTRKYGGTGLGLAISLKLAELMGGTIHVNSKIDKGSTFTLELPSDGRDTAECEHSPPSRSLPADELATLIPKPAAGRNTVMVVDDDPAVRDMLQRFLSKEGFKVVTVEKGADVVSRARQVRPHAITLDVMMPDLDGWTVMSALKAEPDLADIPVVMLTIVDDKNMGYAMGAADYLTKPFDRRQLLGSLNKFCNVKSPGLALVVEDDASSRELLRRTLEKDGWTIIEASNGRTALDCVANQCPSLILLDLMMPEMDGFEFLDELRQHPQWQSIPVIIITAKELTEEDRMYLSGSLFLSGCVRRVLQKGRFDRQELLQEVRQLVGSAEGPARESYRPGGSRHFPTNTGP